MADTAYWISLHEYLNGMGSPGSDPSAIHTGDAAGGVLSGTYPSPGFATSVAGLGLGLSSDVLSVNVDNSTIEISADTLRVKASGITANEIAADAVGSSELANNAVDTAAIQDDAVTAAKIAADAVGSSEIAANAVGSSELADNSVDTAAIQDDAVTAAKIAADAVGSSEIAANAVGSSELADNAVDTAAIQDDAVTAAKIAADAVGASEIAAGAVGSSELADTAVTPGTYGDATHVGTFTVDQDGRLTAASNTSITGSSGTSQHILLADGHATPFSFNDCLQMDDGSDFMWND